MNVWNSLAGMVRVRITSACVETALLELNTHGIVVMNLVKIDELSATAQIMRRDYRRARKLARQKGCEIDVEEKKGVYWSLKGFVRRPVLIAGLSVLFIMSLYLPTRVLFVTVRGNSVVPSRLIVEKASECGIGFGASRREVRSERMKNALLQSLPQLQWAGVNTYGCVAVISVEERTRQNTEKSGIEVNSIVAARDGVIEELTVLRGNALCKVGQAVKRGQLLVSAYTDCGLSIRAEAAQAEIRARTMRSHCSLTLCTSAQRRKTLEEETYYSIKVGKNIINLCKGSGISDPTCVNMYEEIPLMLPGGFQLPVSVLKKRIIYREISSVTELDPQPYEWICDQAKEYLCEQMIAGQVLHCLDSIRIGENVCRYDGVYACSEQIGQIFYERKMQKNG